MSDTGIRRTATVVALALAAVLPRVISDFYRTELAAAAILGIVVLSLVLLTGFVGQISFCQYSFAAIGAFTVGSLVGGHHWSFWLALLVGVAFAALVGVLVAIPALRLRGLFLAILTVAVALFFDRYLIAPGTWDSFSGGLTPWQVGRPSFFGAHLEGSYAFYLFTLGAFTLMSLLVWNLRQGKTGRVLRAIRESEIAASTIGIDVTLWKLLAFGVSAGLAGLAGGLLAADVGSVSPPSFDFLHSVQIAALATVMGVGSVASAAAGGFFLVALPEFLRHTPLSADYFPLIVGAALVVQLQFAPEGAVVKAASDLRHLLARSSETPQPRAASAAAAQSDDGGNGETPTRRRHAAKTKAR